MRNILLFILLLLAALSFSARYMWNGTDTLEVWGVSIAPGDTVSYTEYKTDTSSTGWVFIDHLDGINPFFTSVILTVSDSSWDTIDIDIGAEHIDVISTVKIHIYINDTTGVVPIETYSYWTEDVFQTVGRLIIQGYGTGATEVHAYRKVFK